MTMTKKQESILKNAQSHFELGDYSKALPLLTTLVDQKIESEHLFHMLGNIYYEEGKFKPAISCFKKSLSINPSFTDSSIGLSVILNDLGKYKEAQEVFLSAQNKIKKQTQKPEEQVKSQIAYTHLKLGNLYLQYNQPYKALEHISTHDELTNETKDTMNQKVQIYRSLANFKKAIEHIKNWITKNSPDSEVLFKLAETYYLNKQPLAALSTCERILKASPNHISTLKFYTRLKNTTFDLREKEI